MKTKLSNSIKKEMPNTGNVTLCIHSKIYSFSKNATIVRKEFHMSITLKMKLMR